MRISPRHQVLFGLLALSAMLVGWDRWHAVPQVTQAVQRAASSHATLAPASARSSRSLVAASSAINELKLRRFDELDDTASAFGVSAPLAAAPAAASAPTVTVEAPPTAPALPFTVIGKQLAQGKWEVYLATTGEPILAHEGDTISEQYKVERIDPPTMTLTYLPLRQNQTLQIGPSFND